jgi:hypothetical protein
MIVFSKWILNNGKSLVFFTLALLVTFAVPFLTVDMNDNPYQVKLGIMYYETNLFLSSMTFFSQYVYYLIYRFVGDYFIYYKLFNSFAVFLTILMPLCFFYKRFSASKYIFIAAIITLLYIPFCRLSIGWDAISDFFIMLSFLSFIKFVYFKKHYFIILGVVATILAIFTKITNLILPFLYVFFYLLYNKNQISFLKIVKIGLFFIGFGISYYLAIFLFFDELDVYFRFSDEKESFNESYSIVGLLERIFNHLKFSLKPAFLVGIYYFGFIWYQGKFSKYIKIATLFLSVFLFFHFIKIERNYYIYALVFHVILFLIIVYEASLKKMSYFDKLLLFSVLIFGFVPALGSNTGLSKINHAVYVPFLLCFFPFASSYKKYIPLGILFILYSVCLKLVYFADMQPITSEFVVNDGKLFPILSSKKNSDMRSDLDEYLKNNSFNQVYFFGMNSHIFEYLHYKQKPVFDSFDRNLNTKADYLLLEKEITSRKKNLCFIYVKDAYVSSISQLKQTYFYKELQKYPLKVSEDENFIKIIIN